MCVSVSVCLSVCIYTSKGYTISYHVPCILTYGFCLKCLYSHDVIYLAHLDSHSGLLEDKTIRS